MQLSQGTSNLICHEKKVHTHKKTIYIWFHPSVCHSKSFATKIDALSILWINALHLQNWRRKKKKKKKPPLCNNFRREKKKSGIKIMEEVAFDSSVWTPAGNEGPCQQQTCARKFVADSEGSHSTMRGAPV